MSTNDNLAGKTTDSNGKSYKHYELITQGELKGHYRQKSFPSFGFNLLNQQEQFKEYEDILKSGFHIFTFDPKGD